MKPYDKPICQIPKLFKFVDKARDSTKSDDFYYELWYHQNCAEVEENTASKNRPNPIFHLCAFSLFISYTLVYILRYQTVPKNSIP